MTPVQLLARIAALIPPPRFPLVRFAGVLAPSSPMRAAVVALRPASSVVRAKPLNPKKKRKKKTRPSAAEGVSSPTDNAPPPPSRPRSSLGTGVVRPCYSRIDWASLLRRIYLEDVLACPCGGRRRILADVTEPAIITDILTHLGLDPEPPTLARARDPTDDVA
jgi:hypothetical protein